MRIINVVPEMVQLQLGKQGENKSTKFLFDVSDWLEKYPGCTITMVNRRPNENSSYPCVLTTEEDGRRGWVINSADLAIDGKGECELKCTLGDMIEKDKRTWKTNINKSLSGDGNAPAPWESLMDDIEGLVGDAQDAAEDAETAKEAAEEAAGVAAHAPIIQDGYWYVWDATTEQYVNSGVKAQGQDTTPALITADYSELTFPVAAGTMCSHNGLLYKANQTIATSEAWTAAHWTQTTIEAEQSTLKTEIVNSTNLAKNGFLYTDAKCSTFTNKFNVRGMNGQGIKVVGDEVIGSATAFGSSYDANPYPVSCDANTRYTLALDAYTEQNESGASKNGMLIDFLYSDGTTSSGIMYLNCSYATWNHYTLTSSSNKTIVGVRFKSNYYPSNIWHLKNIMLAVGTTETTFIPYYIPKDNEARERVATAEENIQRLQTVGREHLNDDIQFFYGGINTNSGADYIDVNNAYVKTDFLSNVSRITVASGYGMTIVNFTKDLEYISKTAVSGGIWKMEDAPSNMRYIRINMSKSGGINISNIHSLVSVYQTEEAYGSEIKDIQKCNPCAVREYTYTGERISLSHKMSSELFNTKMDITGVQDGVILGNEMFIFNSSGAFVVMDCVTRAKLGTGTLEDPISGKYPHVNSASQSNEVNENGYNYLYLNAYNNDGFPKGTCYVYSISKSGGTYTATVVQTITIGFTEETVWDGGSSVRPYGNFVVDTDNDALYVFTVHSDTETRFFKFDLPSLESASVTLAQSDIKDQFDVDGDNFQYPQGCTYSNGKIFALSGFSGSGCLHVIDLGREKEVTTIQLSTIGINSEPEFASEYKGDLIVDSYSNFMRLKF